MNSAGGSVGESMVRCGHSHLGGSDNYYKILKQLAEDLMQANTEGQPLF